MHKKTFPLLATISLLITLFVLSSVAFAKDQSLTDNPSPVTNAGEEAQPTAVPEPDKVDLALPPAGKPGFTIPTDIWNPEPGRDYSANGTYHFWTWASLNPGKNQYNWGTLDGWIQRALDAGYDNVSIAIDTYPGRYAPCAIQGVPFQGVDAMPKWVRVGPDGVLGTGDDAVLESNIPDGRTGDGCTNYGGPWYVPYYTSPNYTGPYYTFVSALADHLLNSPYRNHIGWVAIGTGKGGENIPVDKYVANDHAFLLNYVSQTDWVDFVKGTIDAYTAAFHDGSGFPRIQLFVQNAPFYVSAWERRDIADYAASKNVGIAVNTISSDWNFSEACGSPNPSINCTGFYDQIRQHNNRVAIQFEGYTIHMATENEFYWAMSRALDYRADYIRLSGFWHSMDSQTTRKIAKWTAKYLGKGLFPGQEEPPSIWSRMREHRNPVYLPHMPSPITGSSWPMVGNYEFYLNQKNLSAYQSVTIPVTDDDRITWTGGTNTDEMQEPWHLNQHPYDANLRNAGLYKLVTVTGQVQGDIDPGWLARRTDQANNQVRFIFDAADRYFPQTSPPTTYKAIVTVTYLDVGSDKWFLQYDSVNGIKRATPYAINDWTPERGLAIDGGLPTTGVLNNPEPGVVTKTNTGKWKVVTFLIEDGNFNNGLFGGNGDIAIDSRDPVTGDLDGDEYIHHVDVQKVDEFVEPVKTGVKGFVYVDMNENGQRDSWEPGIHNATVTLSGAVQYQTTTTGSGYYEIDDAAPGQYTITASPPPGYEQLTPSSMAIYIPDGAMLRIDFKHPPIETQSVLYLPMMQAP